jgi:hypothetical protein
MANSSAAVRKLVEEVRSFARGLPERLARRRRR